MEEQRPLSKMKKEAGDAKTHLICTLHFWMNCFIYVVVMSTITVAGLGYVPPVKLGFFCEDPHLSYKYNGETISAVMLGVISLLISLVMIVPTEMLRQKSSKWTAKKYCLYLFKEGLIGHTLVYFITFIAKVSLGAHRPQFFDICQPDMAVNCTVGTYVHNFTCTTYETSSYASVTDSSLSFPSGHASISCFVGMYLSYVVQERIPKNAASLTKPFLIVICISYSAVCSLSRIVDRMHHWWDVLGGAILGLLVALNTIRLVHQRLQDIDRPQSINNPV